MPSVPQADGGPIPGDLLSRLDRLRAKRLAEDERLVCMERAQILIGTKEKHAHLSRAARQAAIVRDLCEQITPEIEPEDFLVGRMPETLPTADEEQFIEQHPELFLEHGVSDWLDSMSIYAPEWDWLVDVGLGGIAAEAQRRLAAVGEGDEADERREFLEAMVAGLEAVSLLIGRYAQAARLAEATEDSPGRKSELESIAKRCDRIAGEAPRDFVEALQLLQLVHMVLSCLVGGRDVTPARLDQYLLRLYRQDIENGTLTPDDASALLATFFLRLSQMAGNGTDYDDNVRRSPCTYTHLYVTVGGRDAKGRSVVNELSYVVADAIRLLNYKEPTLLVRHHAGMAESFAETTAALVRDRFPVTIYNDEVVVPALVNLGVPVGTARGYAHSACHNVLVPGHEAGSGPGGFHNAPRLLLLAMNGGRDPATGAQTGAPTPPPEEIDTFDKLWSALREQMRFLLANVRRATETRWHSLHEDACPLLQSALMRHSVAAGRPCWHTAEISHLNHYLVGLATTVDSLLAIQRVGLNGGMGIKGLLDVLANDWSDHDALRTQVLTGMPRYGQDCDEATELAADVCQLWCGEVLHASEGLTRLQMWPAFYSHSLHARAGRETPATPDGRRAGDPLSEGVAPSFGTANCPPTTSLRAMGRLPFDRAPSGATSLTLHASDMAGDAGIDRLISLLDTYFGLGGLHLHFNVIDAATLRDAMANPERHSTLMVRVAGFSAHFTRLSTDIQQDIVRRYERDVGGR